MSEALQPTPGPWRWEFNRKHRSVSLQGGARPFDLTVMDFSRWGTQGAIPNLRDPAIDGMNVMHRLCDRPDWISPFPGRSHHADWCANVIHPDMRLMAAAPAMLKALESAEWMLARDFIDPQKRIVLEAVQYEIRAAGGKARYG